MRQIEERDSLWEFPCYRDDGNIFDWHGLKGRPVLLLYGGLGCMGEDGRKELELFTKANIFGGFADCGLLAMQVIEGPARG